MQVYTIDNHDFLATPSQVQALNILLSSNAGGFAQVHGYVSTSGRIVPEKANITFISRFSYSKLLQRKIDALNSLSFETLYESAAFKASKANEETDTQVLVKTFNDRKQYLIESAQKTLSGDRSDAHRQAHDRCYLRLDNGIRIHYKTVDVNGMKEPVTIDGVPVCESIMLDMIQVKKEVIEKGEYKPKKSGLPVLVGNVIESLLPMSTKFKALSLKSDNFDSLTIAGNELIPDDIKGLFN